MLDSAINRHLASSGSSCRADRAYCFKFHDAGTRLTNTHEWCAPSVGSFKEHLTDIASEALPIISTRVRDKQVVVLDRRSGELPPKEAHEMEMEGIVSLLIVPIIHQDQVIGFAGSTRPPSLPRSLPPSPSCSLNAWVQV